MPRKFTSPPRGDQKSVSETGPVCNYNQAKEALGNRAGTFKKLHTATSYINFNLGMKV